jgi:hypothetical protein
MKSYGVHSAQADRYGGDWVVSAFAKYNVQIKPSEKPKSDIYVELLPLLNGHRCQLLDHPRMVAQLCGLERRTARSGKDSIDHGPAANAHDDIANAVAGVLLLVSAGKPPLRFSPEMMERIGATPSRRGPPPPGSVAWG